MGSIGDNDSDFNVGDISQDADPAPQSIHQTALLSDRQEIANRSSFIVSPSKVGLGARDSSQLQPAQDHSQMIDAKHIPQTPEKQLMISQR